MMDWCEHHIEALGMSISLVIVYLFLVWLLI